MDLPAPPLHDRRASLLTRNADREHRPLAETGALGLDLTAVELHDPAGDREPQPEPGASLAMHRPLPERLEQRREQPGTHPRSAVRDTKAHLGPGALQPGLDAPSLGSELHRVPQQVDERLLEPWRIGLEAARGAVARPRQSDP